MITYGKILALMGLIVLALMIHAMVTDSSVTERQPFCLSCTMAMEYGEPS